MVVLLQGFPVQVEDALFNPIVFLTSKTCRILLVSRSELVADEECESDTIYVFYVPSGHPFECTLSASPKDKSFGRVRRFQAMAHSQIEWSSTVIRSCDNGRMTFRDKMIDKLRNTKPQTLISIGDTIYADMYVHYSEPSMDKARTAYFHAWCDTMDKLADVTLNSIQIWIGDDHEIADNVNVSDLTDTTMQGYAIFGDMYRFLSQGLRATQILSDRQSKDFITPYDSFLIPDLSGRHVLFLAEYDRQTLHQDVRQILATLADSHDDLSSSSSSTPLMVISNRPRLCTSSDPLMSAYYKIKDWAAGKSDSSSMDTDGDMDLFKILEEYPGQEPVLFVAGDYHYRMSGQIGRVDIRVTSPFAGLSSWSLFNPDRYIHDKFDIDADLNFYLLSPDTSDKHGRFVKHSLSPIDRCTNLCVLMFHAAQA